MERKNSHESHVYHVNFTVSELELVEIKPENSTMNVNAILIDFLKNCTLASMGVFKNEKIICICIS